MVEEAVVVGVVLSVVIVLGVFPISLSEKGSWARARMRAFRLHADKGGIVPVTNPLFCTEDVPVFCPGWRARGKSGLPTAVKISLPTEDL